MREFHCRHRSIVRWLITLVVAWIGIAFGRPLAVGAEVTLQGSLVCNGACVPEPKSGDHVMALFAIDGTPEVRAKVDSILKEYFL